MKKIFAVAAALVLTGCATSSVIVGKVRPPTTPDAVKLYVKPPAEFEQIALLETSSKSSFAFSEQGKMDAVMANLKTEAAKHGANGILLNATGNQQQNGFVFMPGAAGAAGIAVPYGSNDKTGNAVAIFVTKE